MTTPAPTERLHFRTWQPEDLELAVGLWGDPEVARFIYVNGLVTQAMIADRLAREMDSQAQYGIQYWPIEAARAALDYLFTRPAR
jgi:[ribosomal protein S5]-alanine N-acetyltransferase